MRYKGIEYKILQTTTVEIWAWSFDPPESVPVHGKTEGTRDMADAAAQLAIDEWLKSP